MEACSRKAYNIFCPLVRRSTLCPESTIVVYLLTIPGLLYVAFGCGAPRGEERSSPLFSAADTDELGASGSRASEADRRAICWPKADPATSKAAPKVE